MLGYIQLYHLKCAFCVWMSVFVLVCMIPNYILTSRVASWQKTRRIAALQQTNWHWSKILSHLKSLSIHLKSSITRHIKTWINHLINLQCKAHCLPLSIALTPVACPQSGNRCEHWVWGGGRNYFLQYFKIRLRYQCQLLVVNNTYSIFKD